MNISSRIVKQFLGFFALVRVQNIILLLIAFILTAKYIFVPKMGFYQLLFDENFVLLLLATIITVASGYIINSFYDYKKDLINRPKKTLLEQQLAQRKRLYLYFSFNILAVIFAGFISYRAALFFSVYIFLIWFYSHKISTKTFIGNIWMTVLSIFPFFGIFLYFKLFNAFIFWHAVFLFLLLLIKDLVKDMISIKGDLVKGSQTIPIVYGERKSKIIILITSILLLIPIVILNRFAIIGNMKYFFYIFLLLYFIGLLVFFNAKSSTKYYYFYNLIKVLLILGVFSVILVQK